jgi:hypothetical protein
MFKLLKKLLSKLTFKKLDGFCENTIKNLEDWCKKNNYIQHINRFVNRITMLRLQAGKTISENVSRPIIKAVLELYMKTLTFAFERKTDIPTNIKVDVDKFFEDSQNQLDDLIDATQTEIENIDKLITENKSAAAAATPSA